MLLQEKQQYLVLLALKYLSFPLQKHHKGLFIFQMACFGSTDCCFLSIILFDISYFSSNWRDNDDRKHSSYLSSRTSENL